MLRLECLTVLVASSWPQGQPAQPMQTRRRQNVAVGGLHVLAARPAARAGDLLPVVLPAGFLTRIGRHDRRGGLVCVTVLAALIQVCGVYRAFLSMLILLAPTRLTAEGRSGNFMEMEPVTFCFFFFYFSSPRRRPYSVDSPETVNRRRTRRSVYQLESPEFNLRQVAFYLRKASGVTAHSSSKRMKFLNGRSIFFGHGFIRAANQQGTRTFPSCRTGVGRWGQILSFH